MLKYIWPRVEIMKYLRMFVSFTVKLLTVILTKQFNGNYSKYHANLIVLFQGPQFALLSPLHGVAFCMMKPVLPDKIHQSFTWTTVSKKARMMIINYDGEWW